MSHFIQDVVREAQESSSTLNLLDRRDVLLRRAKVRTEREQRDLQRDRLRLEREEARLMAEVKKQVLKNDPRGAQLVAARVAQLRSLERKNLARAMDIALKTDALQANHRINRATVASTKAVHQANRELDIPTVQEIALRYQHKMAVTNSIEDSMNSNLDDIFADGDSDGSDMEFEVANIVEQAIAPKEWRKNALPPFPFADRRIGLPENDNITINFRSLGHPSQPGTSFKLDTLEISVDMLKRQLALDNYCISQLGIEGKGFELGRMVDDKFKAFEFTESLKKIGIRPNETLFVSVINSRVNREDASTTSPTRSKSKAK